VKGIVPRSPSVFCRAPSLTLTTIYACSYGGNTDSYPHPELDLPGFLAAVHKCNKKAGKVFDPVTLRARDWIDEAKLKTLASPGGCVVM